MGYLEEYLVAMEDFAAIWLNKDAPPLALLGALETKLERNIQWTAMRDLRIDRDRIPTRKEWTLIGHRCDQLRKSLKEQLP